jgi:hypothetical protein
MDFVGLLAVHDPRERGRRPCGEDSSGGSRQMTPYLVELTTLPGARRVVNSLGSGSLTHYYSLDVSRSHSSAVP